MTRLRPLVWAILHPSGVEKVGSSTVSAKVKGLRIKRLMLLLDVSDRVRQSRQHLDSFRAKYANDLDDLDHELNGSFWCRLAGVAST